jgi:hypothetical protein
MIKTEECVIYWVLVGVLFHQEKSTICDNIDAGYRSIYNIAGPINIS